MPENNMERNKKVSSVKSTLPSLHRDLHPVYEIRARLHPKRYRIEGTVKVAFDNPKTEQILFYLYDYPSYEFQIKQVRFPKEPTVFSLEGNSLSFENKFRMRERLVVEIDFSVPVPRQGTRFGTKENIWILTNWYPLLGVLDKKGDWFKPVKAKGFGDPFFYAYGDYRVRLRAPSSFRWVTSGTLLKEIKEGTETVFTWKADKVLTFALVGSPRYHIRNFQVDNVRVTIALTSSTREQQIQSIVQQSLAIFRDKFGPLPYSNVSIAETGSGTTFAMEYPNLAIFSRDLYAGNQLERWLVHEIAHLWWYNAVHPNEPDHGWIDEGLAEMGLFYYLKERYGEKQARSLIQESEKKWQQLARRFPKGKLATPLSEFSSYQEFFWTWYKKSVILFFTLREQLGEPDFERFLQALLQNAQGKVIDASHLDEALKDVLGMETDFFSENEKRIHQDGLSVNLPSQNQQTFGLE
ncbi:hypothetical protein BSNK01_23940 [Bacillaceae bacterium]